MTAVTLDTMKIVETLESAGFEREKASAVAAVVRDAHINASTDVATKGDIALLRQEMETWANKIVIRIGGLFIAVMAAVEVINRVWPKA